MNTAHPLTPVSNHVGLDGMHTTAPEVGQWSGGARKRKRETCLSQVQKSPFGSPVARSMPTLHEQYYSRPRKSRRNNPISSPNGGGYMSDSPPAAYRSPQRVQQRREQTYSESFLGRSGYENGPALAVRSTRASQVVDHERVERRSGFKRFRS